MANKILAVDDGPGCGAASPSCSAAKASRFPEAGWVADAGRLLKGEPYNLVILNMEPLNGFDLLMLARRDCPRQAGDLQSRIYRLLGADGR